METFKIETALKDIEEVNGIMRELGPSEEKRREIIIDRFGGASKIRVLTIMLIESGFGTDKNLKKAFLECNDKANIMAMVSGSIEVGYMIAEERYEERLKILEAKLMIAEEELKKAKEVRK